MKKLFALLLVLSLLLTLSACGGGPAEREKPVQKVLTPIEKFRNTVTEYGETDDSGLTGIYLKAADLGLSDEEVILGGMFAATMTDTTNWISSTLVDPNNPDFSIYLALILKENSGAGCTYALSIEHGGNTYEMSGSFTASDLLDADTFPYMDCSDASYGMLSVLRTTAHNMVCDVLIMFDAFLTKYGCGSLSDFRFDPATVRRVIARERARE